MAQKWQGIGYVTGGLSKKELEKEVKKWRKKLEASGFEDLEVMSNNGYFATYFDSKAGNSVTQQGGAVRHLVKKERVEFYQRWYQFSENYDFKTLRLALIEHIGEVYSEKFLKLFCDTIAQGYTATEYFRKQKGKKVAKTKIMWLYKFLDLYITEWVKKEEDLRTIADARYLIKLGRPQMVEELLKVYDGEPEYTIEEVWKKGERYDE